MQELNDTSRRRLFKFASAAAVIGLLHACSAGDDSGRATSGGGGFTPGSEPAISVQPANQSVIAGATASFSVTASGSPAPTYQWQISDDNGVTFADITGATSSSYTTGVTAGSNSGQLFRVVVTNSAGSITSNAATLTVTAVVGSAGGTDTASG
jgi:hypothetical protein